MGYLLIILFVKEYWSTGFVKFKAEKKANRKAASFGFRH